MKAEPGLLLSNLFTFWCKEEAPNIWTKDSDSGQAFPVPLHPPRPLLHRCSCPSGFEGPTCGVNTDDCVKHACVNGGVCVDGVGNYTCQCPLQYTGKHCRGKASPSFGDASVCKGSREDSGICCLLLLLPLGRACEKLVDFCSPDLNPCQHEAQCVGTPDGPRSVPPTASDPSLGLASSLPSYPSFVGGYGLGS